MNEDYRNINDLIKRSAMKFMQEDYSHLKGEEKTKAMRERSENIFDALTIAIETLEKDITFNPRQFLGVALYPD